MAREPDSSKANHLTGILKSARPAAQSTRLPDRSVQISNGIQNIKKAAIDSLTVASPFPKNLAIQKAAQATQLHYLPFRSSLSGSLIFYIKINPLTQRRHHPPIAVDRAPDIQPADAFTPTGPLTVVPYENGFQMHAGCAFFRAPRHVEQSNAMAQDKNNAI